MESIDQDIVGSNPYRRYMCPGAQVDSVCVISKYMLVQREHLNVETIRPAFTETKWKCPIHDIGCLGHIERIPGVVTKRDIYLLPCTMTPDMPDRKSKYSMSKIAANRHGSRDKYTSSIAGYMMGKRGAIRTMNTCCVDGTIKMVISAGSYENTSHVMMA